MNQPIDLSMSNKEVMPLFPSLVWKSQLNPQACLSLNQRILAKLDELTEGQPPLQEGQMWQTDQRFNELAGMEALDSMLRTAAKGVLDSLKVRSDNFEITGCWANISAPGTPHNLHTHPNNYLSGVYYVKTQPRANGLHFHDPRSQVKIIEPAPLELSPATAGKIRVEVSPGTLVMFPAWLEHSVDPNQSGDSRVSIAFNIMFSNFSETISRPRWKANLSLDK